MRQAVGHEALRVHPTPTTSEPVASKASAAPAAHGSSITAVVPRCRKSRAARPTPSCTPEVMSMRAGSATMPRVAARWAAIGGAQRRQTGLVAAVGEARPRRRAPAASGAAVARPLSGNSAGMRAARSEIMRQPAAPVRGWQRQAEREAPAAASTRGCAPERAREAAETLRISTGGARGNEQAGGRPRFNQSFDHQRFVGADDGVARDFELFGKAPARRQPDADRKLSAGDRLAELAGDLVGEALGSGAVEQAEAIAYGVQSGARLRRASCCNAARRWTHRIGRQLAPSRPSRYATRAQGRRRRLRACAAALRRALGTRKALRAVSPALSWTHAFAPGLVLMSATQLMPASHCSPAGAFDRVGRMRCKRRLSWEFHAEAG